MKKVVQVFGALTLSLCGVSGTYGINIKADYGQEMDLLPAASGWGAYVGSGGGEVDGLLYVEHPGGVPGTWFHPKGTALGGLGPTDGSILKSNTATVAGTTKQWTMDVRFKMSNYDFAHLLDRDGDPFYDSVPDGDPTYDPPNDQGEIMPGGNPTVPPTYFPTVGATSQATMPLRISQQSGNSSQITAYLGYSNSGYQPYDPNTEFSGFTPKTGIFGNRYASSWVSTNELNGGTNSNDQHEWLQPGQETPFASGVPVGDPAWQSEWHVMRLQSMVDGATQPLPFLPTQGQWRGRVRALITDNTGVFRVIGEYDITETNPGTAVRDESLAIFVQAGGIYEADLEFDYVRVSKSIVPDNVLIAAANDAGASPVGSIVLSGTTTLEIAGVKSTDFPNPTPARTLIPGTDYDIIRAPGTVTLGGTMNFLGSTQEEGTAEFDDPDRIAYPNGLGTENSGVGGFLGVDRRTPLPDIGQGPSRRLNDEFGDPGLIVVDPALHRGKKLVREGIIKGSGAVNSILGDFAAVTYWGESNSSLNEEGLFVKAPKADSNKRVDFVLLNARLGDADGDEIVSATDVFTTLSNLGAAVAGQDWNRGNFDGDTLVSASDVFTALSNLGAYTPTVISGDVSSVPEPSSGLLALLALATPALARRRQ